MGTSGLKQYCCNYGNKEENEGVIDDKDIPISSGCPSEGKGKFGLLYLGSKSNRNFISASTSKLRLRTLICRQALDNPDKIRSSNLPKDVLLKMKTLVWNDVLAGDAISSKNIFAKVTQKFSKVDINNSKLKVLKTLIDKDFDKLNCSSEKDDSFSVKLDYDDELGSNLKEKNSLINEEDQDDIEISEEDENMLRSSVSNLFPRLTTQEITMFIQNFFYQAFKKNTTVIHGPNTMFLFIIKSGRVGLFKGKDLKKVFSAGDCFGNINIFEKYNPNDDNIKFDCLDDCTLFMISSEQIEGLKKELLEKKHIQFLKILNSISVLRYLDNNDKLALIDEVVLERYEKNEFLQCQQDNITCIFYIIEGHIEKGVIKDISYKSNSLKNIKQNSVEKKEDDEKKSCTTLAMNSFLNEEILFSRNLIAKQYLKSRGCTVAVISINLLTKVFGENYRDYLLFKMFCQLATKCSLIRKLVRELFIKEQLDEDIHFLNTKATLYTEESAEGDFIYCSDKTIYKNTPNKNQQHESPFQRVYEKLSLNKYNEGNLVMTKGENKVIFIIKGSILNVSCKNFKKIIEQDQKNLQEHRIHSK